LKRTTMAGTVWAMTVDGRHPGAVSSDPPDLVSRLATLEEASYLLASAALHLIPALAGLTGILGIALVQAGKLPATAVAAFLPLVAPVAWARIRHPHPLGRCSTGGAGRRQLGGRDSNPDSRLQRPESCH
jgi:hypothetical protein